MDSRRAGGCAGIGAGLGCPNPTNAGGEAGHSDNYLVGAIDDEPAEHKTLAVGVGEGPKGAAAATEHPLAFGEMCLQSIG